MPDITIADLAGNGTLSPEVAAVLWAAVDRQASFLTVALPRLAGKSTTSKAVLGMRPPDVPLHRVAGEPREMDELRQAKSGGYLVVEEFSHAPMHGYIWGAPVKRVFDTLDAGYSLQACLHATSAIEGFEEVTFGNGISDEQASTFKLVLYIERFGTSTSNFWRRLVDLYEVHGVKDGRPMGQSLFKWEPNGDKFVQTAQSRYFADADLPGRADVIRRLAEDRASPDQVAQALESYRIPSPSGRGLG